MLDIIRRPLLGHCKFCQHFHRRHNRLARSPEMNSISPSPIRIGILEDDPLQAQLYLDRLGQAGYRCQLFPTLKEAKEALSKDAFDLLLLDWILPDGTAETLLRWIREQLGWKVPVLVITSCGEEQDITHALQLGADDYVIKPPRVSELLARCQALLRRAAHGPRPQPNDIEHFVPYAIDTRNRLITAHGHPVKLTQKEYELTCVFFRNPGKLMSRIHLLNTVWGHAYEIDTRTIDTHVSQIRRKLGIVPENGWKIVVEYGYGYRLDKVAE